MIDIIIPTHNEWSKLQRALSSIAAQTQRDKCIVTVVDDCSEEDLKGIIDSFRPFIKINYIRLKENKKYPGLVRQIGLDNTNAPYIIFLDSDDILAPQAVEIASLEMRKSNADVLVGYFYKQQGNQYLLMDAHQTTWLHGNVYKRKFLEDNNITFPPGYNEDGAFNTQCYLLSDKVAVLKTPISYWLENAGSITRKEDYFSYIYAKDLITTLIFAYKNIFNKPQVKEKTYSNLGTHFALFYNLIGEIDSLCKTNVDKRLPQAYKEAKKALKDMVKELKINDFNKKQISLFKKGFIKGFFKYCQNKHNILINDFLKNNNINFTIKLEDIQGGVNESHNN